MAPYRVAIIGCGRMAGTIDDEVVGYPALVLPYCHAGAYAAVPQTNLIAAADTDEVKLKSFCDRWHVEKGYTDYREMIETESPDLVSLTTHATLRAETAVFAAEHGVKGIYCEKAMGCSLEECDAIVEAVERNGVKFTYGTLRRWQPGVDKAKDLIASGELGALRTVISYNTSSLLHSASHYFDLLLCLAGDPEVEFVQGHLEGDWDGQGDRLESDPSGIGWVQFASGVRGFALSSPLVAEFEAVCDAGTVRIENNSVSWDLRKRTREYGDKWPGLTHEPFPAFTPKSATVAVVEDLIAALESDGETRCPARLARRGMEIAFGIIESHRRSGAKIRVPLTKRDTYVVSR